MVSDELREKAIQIMKDEGSFKKFKRLMNKGKTNAMVEMVEDIIKRYDLKEGD